LIKLCIKSIYVYYELLQSNQIINHTERYHRHQLLNLNRTLKKSLQYTERHDKIILHDTTLDIWHNTRPHIAELVEEILKALGWDVLFHPPYSPRCSFRSSFVSINAAWTFWVVELQLFRRYKRARSKKDSMIGSPRKNLNFSTTESICYPKSGKKL